MIGPEMTTDLMQLVPLIIAVILMIIGVIAIVLGHWKIGLVLIAAGAILFASYWLVEWLQIHNWRPPDDLLPPTEE